MQKININPPPTYPKPPPPLSPPKAQNGCDGVSNTEVYGALALILLELKEINGRLDEVIKDCEADALDLKHLPDLMYREDKSISL